MVASSLEKLKASHNVEVHWRSFELRPADGPPISAEYRAQILAARPRIYALAREVYGLEMNPGPFGIDTRPALIGAKIAEAEGRGDAYHEAVFRAYWQQAQDISRKAVLAELARAVGMDGEVFADLLEADQYVAEVVDDIRQAQAYGLYAVPALVFNDRYLVSGAQPYETLAEVVERVREAAAQA
ncbi:MAG: DsbA family oxidoreductase [Caldilineae bacterium]|nr:MAG: DsbA family oxidoreductase [Caldilineae bacterium]